MGKHDYTKYANQQVEPEELQNGVEEAVAEPEEKTVEVHGKVVDCQKLNVRMEPYADAEIICTIDCGTEVVVDEQESTEDFYKIYTAAGIEGYCMKRFILTYIL